MLRIKLTFFLLIGLYSVNAQTLSDQAKISVLTFGPGKEELYAGFGHSAIRVYDPQKQIDFAFNYGTFDFDQPNFYLNFTRGHLLYKLAVQDFRQMRRYYEYFNRYILEQIIDLDSAQRQRVFDYLVNNARPENADYYYDYFYNNCSTKIGDVFVEALGPDFKFNDSFVEEPGLTIRNLTDRLTSEEFPWGKLGIDLCLGMPMDKQLNNMEYMFLPDYVYEAFNEAEVRTNNAWHPAVKTDRVLYESKPIPSKRTVVTPMLVFWTMFIVILALSLWSQTKGWSFKWIDVTLFVMVGLVGVLLTLLWLATDHKAAAWNLNILWALPSHVIFGFSLLGKRVKKWQIKYAFFVAGFNILLVIFWALLPQQLNWALVPVTLMLGMRAWFIGRSLIKA